MNPSSKSMEESFQIVNTRNRSLPADLRLIPPLERMPNVVHSVTGKSRRKPHVVIEPSARRVIFEHIHWGIGMRERQCEKAGLLLGEIVFDPDSDPHNLYLNKLNIIVKHALPGDSSRSSEVSVAMDFEAWSGLLKEAEQLTQSLGDPGLCTVGWYHTHPNELKIFFSNDDRNVQQQLFYHAWQVGVVLNPNQSIWGAFRGKECEPCSGFLIDCEDRVEITKR